MRLMSIADIEKVRAAESAANAAKKKAEEDAAQIIADGKKEARDLLDKAAKDADGIYREALDAAEKKASELYDEIIAKEKLACEKIKENGRAKITGVVDDIVGKVMGNN